MQTFESAYFGIRIQIPDSWLMRTWPDTADLRKFARTAARYSPPDATAPGSACRSTRPLMHANLCAPGTDSSIDGTIELSAWISDDASMLDGANRSLKTWMINGIEMRFSSDINLNNDEPENMHYRFPRWKVAPRLWLYARILAQGKARMDYVLSVFQTLAPLKAAPVARRKPLFERDPWTQPPSYFRVMKRFEDKLPLYDVVYDGSISEEIQKSNQMVLDGKASVKRWIPLSFRRRSRVRVHDCYYGPGGWIYSSGIFSDRAIRTLEPHLGKRFDPLPCRVDGKPYWFLRSSRPIACLDESLSQIKRFDDGRIMSIERYRFDRNLVPDSGLFALPQERHRLVATASLAKLVHETQLTGLDLHPIDGTGRDVTCPG